MNRQVVIGHLGGDAEFGKTQKAEYISFSVAADCGYGEYKRTEWIDCIKFGSTKVGEYLKKGTKVYLAGDCWNEEYQGKNGKALQRKIQVSELEILTPKSEAVGRNAR